MMASHNEAAVRNEHLRAICDEVGYRLGLLLDKTSTDPSPRLRAVLLRFEEAEQIEAPSIVPSVEDLDNSEALVYGER